MPNISKLIKKFKSFDNIKKLDKDKLVKVIGEKRTYSLLRYLEINTPKG